MDAILLAAGIGRRLEGREGPKCLLSMGEDHLLGRTLRALSDLAIRRVTIVVGYDAAEVESAAAARDGGSRVRCVFNPDFRRGSIVSLWRAREALDGDVLIMDADVLFPRLLLRRLAASPHASCALLDGRVTGNGEEMILCAAGGRVWDIVRRGPDQVLAPPAGVNAYDALGESVGFLKVGAAHAPILRQVLEERIAAGDRDAEHESAYPSFFCRCPVGYERVDDLPWTEIDFSEDVQRARARILPRVEALDATAGHGT